MNLITELFAASPFRPLQSHMAKAHDCVVQLKSLFSASFADDWENVIKTQQTIAELENEADELKREIRLRLPGGVFFPVARTDLLQLIKTQDKLANTARDIAGLVAGRKMQIPQPVQPIFEKYLDRTIDATAQAMKAINELDELVETGFRGREAQLVENMVVELDNIENDTDQLQRELRAELFAIEAELAPVNVYFLYQVIDLIGSLGDRAERVGAELELMLASK